MSRRPSGFDRPADRLLESLRRAYPDAYRNVGIGRWAAYCPACDDFLYQRRGLVVYEPFEGGDVTVRCESSGCSKPAILTALRQAQERRLAGDDRAELTLAFREYARAFIAWSEADLAAREPVV